MPVRKCVIHCQTGTNVHNHTLSHGRQRDASTEPHDNLGQARCGTTSGDILLVIVAAAADAADAAAAAAAAAGILLLLLRLRLPLLPLLLVIVIRSRSSGRGRSRRCSCHRGSTGGSDSRSSRGHLVAVRVRLVLPRVHVGAHDTVLGAALVLAAPAPWRGAHAAAALAVLRAREGWRAGRALAAHSSISRTAVPAALGTRAAKEGFAMPIGAILHLVDAHRPGP